MDKRDKRNKYFFGLGTVGRDMVYAMLSSYLLFFLTEIFNLSDLMLGVVGTILLVLRIFDAVNDPVMGVIVDNTNSRWGKYKPAMLIGGVAGSVFFVLLFADLGFSPTVYAIMFTLFYLGWDLTYGLNDIGYWSMLPALTLDQKQRENIGSFARICANIGLFVVVVGILPLTKLLASGLNGNGKLAWLLFAVIVSLLAIGFQMFTLFGVKEHRKEFKKEEATTIKGMFRAIFKNDQLLFAVIAMGLFTIGYTTTANFGTYYFKYAFKNEDMYAIFAAIIGVSQLLALAVFPLFSKRFTRKQLYTGSTILVLLAYVLFFFSPMNMIPIGIAGVMLFVGEAFIQLLILMFLADTIEYGQWKTGKRNQGVTLSLQPLINKLGGAIAVGVTTVTLIVSGINSAKTVNDVSDEGLLMLKLAMFVIPLVCIVLGYIVYRWKYKIDNKFYNQIVAELAERGDIKSDIIK